MSLEVNLSCSCGRHRGGSPGESKQTHESHACPYGVLMRGEEADPSCDCCPVCTVLCLPVKFLRDQEKIKNNKGQKFADLYNVLVKN